MARIPPEENLSQAAVERAAREGTVVPLVREVPADLVTPVGAFLALAAEAPRAFLLESAERGERTGRWSFLGWEPRWSLRAGPDWVERVEPSGARQRWSSPRPLEALREALAPYKPAPVPGVPPFAGGAVGWLAYDAVRWFERLPRRPAPDEVWAEFSVYERLVALDHLKHRVLVVASIVPERDGLERGYSEARAWAEAAAAALLAPPIGAWAPPGPLARGDGEPPVSLTPPEMFLEGVERLKRAIREGEIFQGVLSQRFVRALRVSPFGVYRALRRINPSPYLFYLASPEMSLAGSSPEMLLRCRGRSIETHPIAGTRPRGEDAAADAALEAELRGDPKENAEHLMLVDLGRNDLGRVAVPGSVEVESYGDVERYSHVMHLVSRVRAILAPERDALDALVAAFPAGTVTGAPKVRAMEWLDALEPVPRGPYAGAVAYLDFAGNLDSCIAIRTLVAREGRAEVQAGAGVVADSVPEREYNETVAKARALLDAAAWAEEVFG